MIAFNDLTYCTRTLYARNFVAEVKDEDSLEGYIKAPSGETRVGHISRVTFVIQENLAISTDIY